MQIRYYKEYSRFLNRFMEFKVYGHAGRPIVIFPCQSGRFFDWEDRNMCNAAAPWRWRLPAHEVHVRRAVLAILEVIHALATVAVLVVHRRQPRLLSLQVLPLALTQDLLHAVALVDALQLALVAEEGAQRRNSVNFVFDFSSSNLLDPAASAAKAKKQRRAKAIF